MESNHRSSSLHVRDRRTDILLAILLAIFPLLPSGPLYLGLPGANYSDLGVFALLVFWLALSVRGRRSPSVTPKLWPGFFVSSSWGAFLVISTGAALVGLSIENDPWSPVFWAYVREAPGRLTRPMDQLTDPLYPLRVWVVFLEGGIAFAVVRHICLRARNPQRRALTALHGWLAGYGLVAILAVLQYMTEFNLHSYWVRVNPGLVRSHSTLDDPNALGSYLVLGLGIAVGLAFLADPGRTRRRPVYIALVLLGLSALVTTVSRTAWIGLLMTLSLFIGFGSTRVLRLLSFDYRPLRRVTRFLVLAVLGVVLVSLVARLWVPVTEGRYQPQSPVQTIAYTLDPRVPLAEVFQNRFSWWQAAVRMFDDEPLVGVGLGRYPRLVGNYGDPGVPPENAHSFALQVLTEMGVLGFAGLGLLIGAAIISLVVASTRPHRENAALGLGALLGFSAFLVTCLAGHPLLLASGQIALATMLATVLVASAPAVPQNDHREELQDTGFETAPGRWATPWLWTTRVLVGLALVCYPAAALRDTPPPSHRSVWGYTWGLFPEEVPRGSPPYRWTGERAILEMRVPNGTRSLTLRVAAPSPIREGRSVKARFDLSGQTQSVSFDTPDLMLVEFPVVAEGIDTNHNLRLTIEVDPVFVPSQVAESTDSRRLGLQIFRPRWSGQPEDN